MLPVFFKVAVFASVVLALVAAVAPASAAVAAYRVDFWTYFYVVASYDANVTAGVVSDLAGVFGTTESAITIQDHVILPGTYQNLSFVFTVDGGNDAPFLASPLGAQAPWTAAFNQLLYFFYQNSARHAAAAVDYSYYYSAYITNVSRLGSPDLLPKRRYLELTLHGKHLLTAVAGPEWTSALAADLADAFDISSVARTHVTLTAFVSGGVNNSTLSVRFYVKPLLNVAVNRTMVAAFLKTSGTLSWLWRSQSLHYNAAAADLGIPMMPLGRGGAALDAVPESESALTVTGTASAPGDESYTGALTPTNTPDSDTNAPDSVTNAPGHFTNAPGHVTNAPDSDTNAPDSVTNAPGYVTNAPGSVTPGDESYADAPGLAAYRVDLWAYFTSGILDQYSDNVTAALVSDVAGVFNTTESAITIQDRILLPLTTQNLSFVFTVEGGNETSFLASRLEARAPWTTAFNQLLYAYYLWIVARNAAAAADYSYYYTTYVTNVARVGSPDVLPKPRYLQLTLHGKHLGTATADATLWRNTLEADLAEVFGISTYRGSHLTLTASVSSGVSNSTLSVRFSIKPLLNVEVNRTMLRAFFAAKGAASWLPNCQYLHAMAAAQNLGIVLGRSGAALDAVPESESSLTVTGTAYAPGDESYTGALTPSNAPGSVTNAPDSVTNAPDSVTNAPDPATNAPGSVTNAPGDAATGVTTAAVFVAGAALLSTVSLF
jgi:hypothetical protein